MQFLGKSVCIILSLIAWVLAIGGCGTVIKVLVQGPHGSFTYYLGRLLGSLLIPVLLGAAGFGLFGNMQIAGTRRT